MDHTLTDFFETLDAAGRDVFRVIHEHITGGYPEYKPFDIRPTNKSAEEWTLSYRKRPRTGKAACSLQSAKGQLTVRFCLLSSMTHEFLLRQVEFSSKTSSLILRQMLCCVDNACRCYGGNRPCSWRQNFWVNHRLTKTCPYPWVLFDGLTVNESADIKLLVDLQMNHMTQNSRDIKGGTYGEENLRRCGEVQTILLEQTDLDVDSFVMSDYVKKQAQLEKYAQLYHLIPMGANGGLWFFCSNRSVMRENCDALAYSYTQIPEGRYATVTITDPMKFSANRVWNYLCEWLSNAKTPIREIDLDEQTSTVCFVKFSMENGVESLEMFVPVEG